jgi:hypothetical protein
MAVLAWLFNTKLGQALVALIIIAACWWAFSSHYTGVGYDLCQQEHRDAVAEANVEQSKENEELNKAASDIAKAAADAATRINDESDAESEKTTEVIRYVYRDRPTSAPVSFGSCAHPLDQRVQQQLDEAVNRAND